VTPTDFIAAIAPAARASMSASKIPASFTIAEAALESAWGASGLAVQARNLFGVKADASWKGDVLVMNTREFLHGAWTIVIAKWRKYADWRGCMDDHAAFLHSNRRYFAAFSHAGDAEAFAHAIAAAGYATDPAYANKIISVMRAHNLAQFDKGLP
jgi:flagellum-specific peptidoglycan hydrolase FlgJ